MYRYLRLFFLFLSFIFSPIAFAQKGTWQLALEKKEQTKLSEEEKFALACYIAQEVKEYDMAKALQIANGVLKEAKRKRKRLLCVEGEAYSVIAEIYRLQGRPFEAIEYFEKALTLFREGKSKEKVIQCTLRNKAFAYSSLSKFDSAQRVLITSLDWFRKHEPNTREHAISLLMLGVNTLRLGRYEEALVYTFSAKKILDTLPDSYNQARIQNNIGLIQKNMGHYVVAMQSYLDALQKFEKVGDKQRAVSMVLLNIGNLYASLRDTAYNQYTLTHYDRAHGIAVAIKDTVQIIACIEALAKAKAMQGNFALAKKYYNKGYQLIRQTRNYIEEGYFMIRISDIYMSAAELDTAIAITKQALAFFEKRNALEAIAQTQGKLATFYSRKGEFQTSQDYALAALRNAEKSDYNSIPYLYNVLITNAINLKKFDEAEAWGLYAVTHFKHVNSASSLLEAYRCLIRLDTTRKNDAGAVKWYKLYNQLYDSLFVKEKNKNLLELQFKYNLQDQKRENKYLKEVNEFNRIENQKRGVIILSIGFVLVVVLLLASVLYYNRQKLKGLYHKIENQNENLEKLNLTKDRILSVISHDMRSPLANLKAVLDLANGGFLSLEEQVDITQKLNKDIGRVYDFLQNLLLWAESQMAGFTPHIENVNLHAYTKRVFDIVENQAQNKQISLLNNISTDIELQTDKDILSIVLLNLVSNAIKFTPIEGSIRVGILCENKAIKIMVKDNGVGIALAYQDRIFGQNRFTTNGTNEEKGTGFGLTLCRDFVRVLGGDIYFESELREGTTFYVALPYEGI